MLSTVGTVIGLQSGPLTDTFFLTFDQLGSQTHVVVEPTPTPPPFAPGPIVADIGVRTFAQVNSTLSQLTGVPASTPAVNATYLAVQQQLPSDPTLEGFSSSNQIGIAQLAIQYCNAAVNSPTLQPQVYGTTLSAGQFTTRGRDRIRSRARWRPRCSAARRWRARPPASSITTELTSLIGKLCATNSCSTLPGTYAVAAAACATALRQRRHVDQLSR